MNTSTFCHVLVIASQGTAIEASQRQARARAAMAWHVLLSSMFAISLIETGCGQNSSPPPQAVQEHPARSSVANQPLVLPDHEAGTPDDGIPRVPSQTAELPEEEDAKEEERIRAWISELAKIEDPTLGLSPTMSGEGFAPVPWARRMTSGILMNHGLKDMDAFTQLVDCGPAALPYLLESLDDKTQTQLTIEHGGGFGGMWYGQRPAIRWAASDVDIIRDLAEHKRTDDEIAATVDASPEFVALAKRGKFPFFLPQAQHEFNPANPVEKKVLLQARQEFAELEGSEREFDDLRSAIEEYTVTVGDVCYVIIGQITNRSYLAAQYQPTACVYIHSPTHDAKLARDVRSAWTADDPNKMLLASLRADLESGDGYRGYRAGAVLRLGYYFPRESEAKILSLLDSIEMPPSEGSYESVELLEAIVASRSQAVQERAISMMESTKDVNYFLALSQAYGKEHDSMILERTLGFVDAMPESDDYDGTSISLLRMLGERFPAEGRRVYKQFVESASKHRRDTVINTLWYSPLATELLTPLLDDKRPLHYTDNARVCDRAAQAISNNEEVVSFNSDANVESRDGQIQKIKLHCIGIGVRKTSN